jgi:hypothetical protein
MSMYTSTPPHTFVVYCLISQAQGQLRLDLNLPATFMVYIRGLIIKFAD